MSLRSLRHSRTKAAVFLPSLTAALVLALTALLLAACSNPPAGPDPSTQATIDALATSNAQLSTQVAELSAAAGLPTLTPTPQELPPTPSPAGEMPAAAPAATPLPAEITSAEAAPAVAQPGAGSLPQLLAEIPLAPAGETIYDLRVDRAANRLFVTDSADQLHVLDATTYAEVLVLPYGGWLQLDSEHNRLYVYKPYITQDESLIHVIDTGTLEEVGTVPGRALAIDSERNRLFVGEPYVVSLEQDAPGVRIVDGETLQQTGVFTQAGAPAYNPLRDELLITAYTVYSADPASRQVTGDLFPELTDLGEGGFLWCNGCYWVDSIQYFADEQVVAIAVSRHCTGAGCGEQDAPRFFDANTMQPLDTKTAPRVQANCGSQASLANAVGGRRYVNEMYTRYVVFNNLRVTDEAGALLTQRDGLRIDYVNGRTGQGYLYDGTVIDLLTLAPIGRWPAACLLAQEFAGEPVAGRLYGYREGSLYVIAETGGEPAAFPTPAAEPLPADWTVRQIAVSPDYAADSTLLAISGGGIYRSTDAGLNWQRLRGGLPEGQGSNWTVAFSPGYAADRTIFAGGDRGEYWGEGVWRSTDGGESWQAQWQDLVHRRIDGFYLAPEFSTNGPDQTLVVQAKYYDIAAGQSGDSYQQSTDGGLSWTVAATGSLSSGGPDALPPISELLPGYVAPPALPARLGDLRDAVQVTLDGSTWITAPLTLPEGEWFYALLPGPDYPNDPTLYAFGNLSLWRSSDGGGTWAAWEDARLEGLDYTNEMSAAAVSPALGDGGHRLLVGTANGQVWVLDPAQMTWGEPIAAVPQTANVAASVGATGTGTASTGTPAASAAVTPAAGVTATIAVTPTASITAAASVTPAAAVTAVVTPTGAITAAAAITGTAAVAEGTPTPAVTAEPLAGEPPAGLFRPQGSLGIVWQANARIQQDLGWARQETPAAVAGAYQMFDGGVMVWRGDTSQIFAFLNDGTWQSFADTFEEGDRESDPSFKPPAGRQQPIRGFGKVWRDHPDLREQLGWAIAKEQAQGAEVQSFERGQMLRYGGLVFTVIGVDTDSGRWY